MVTCGFYHRLTEEQFVNRNCPCVGCIGKVCSGCDKKEFSKEGILACIQLYKCKCCLEKANNQR